MKPIVSDIDIIYDSSYVVFERKKFEKVTSEISAKKVLYFGFTWEKKKYGFLKQKKFHSSYFTNK